MSDSPARTYAVVTAGGTGTRLGADVPKQMLNLANRPILAHTLDRLLEYDARMLVAVVLHGSLMEIWPDFLNAYFPPAYHHQLLPCEGGKERTDSVYKGLEFLRALGVDPEGLVAITDGVRPFIDKEMLERGFQLAEARGNAVAGVPVKSSLRMLTEEGSRAIDRSFFYHVQTPQIFRLGEIVAAYESKPEGQFTDDASLAEASGMTIHLFEGSYENIKITTPEDLPIAEQLLAQARRKTR